MTWSPFVWVLIASTTLGRFPLAVSLRRFAPPLTSFGSLLVSQARHARPQAATGNLDHLSYGRLRVCTGEVPVHPHVGGWGVPLRGELPLERIAQKIRFGDFINVERDVVRNDMKCLTSQILALVLLVSASGARGQQTNTQQTIDALNQLSSEMSECATYFIVTSQCFADFPDPRAAKAVADYKRAADNLQAEAFKVGKPGGTTMEAIFARSKMMMDRHMARINKNCANVSILQERYSGFCGLLSQSPDQRVKELLAGRRCSGSYRCD